MALTDKELLLLSSFMYLKDSTTEDEKYETLGDIVNDYVNNNKELTSKKLSGGFETKEGIEKFRQILEEIQECPDLMSLELEEPTDPKYDRLVRGRCFGVSNENESEKEHIIAFRGTGGSLEAWHDNFKGLYMDETPAQKLTREYVEKLDYDNITVTGHSKGGNLAMHVTAYDSTAYKIDYCTSFDGQGYNPAYIENLSPERLKEASSKIKSISTYNDPVNHLLTPIAGEILYFDNAYSGGMSNTHSPYSLYESNKEMLEQTNGIFDENFAVNPDVKTYKTIKSICDISYMMPDCIQKQVADRVGMGVGIAVESTVLLNNAKDNFRKTINSLLPLPEEKNYTLISDDEFRKNTMAYLEKNTDSIYKKLPEPAGNKPENKTEPAVTIPDSTEKDKASALYSLYNEISGKETDSLKIQYIPEEHNGNAKTEEAIQLKILNNQRKPAYNVTMYSDRTEFGLNSQVSTDYSQAALSMPFYVKNSYPEETQQINNFINSYREKTENIKLSSKNISFENKEKENETNKNVTVEIDYK